MDERYLIAVHESGHIVLNSVFDIPLEYAELTNQTVNGIESVSAYSSNTQYSVVTKNMDPVEKKRYAIVWLISTAGGIAADIITGASDSTDRWAADLNQLKVLMAKDADIKVPVAIAYHLLGSHPEIIKAREEILRALLTRGRIENHEINRIIDAKITRDEKNRIKQEIWDKLLGI